MVVVSPLATVTNAYVTDSAGKLSMVPDSERVTMPENFEISLYRRDTKQLQEIAKQNVKVGLLTDYRIE